MVRVKNFIEIHQYYMKRCTILGTPCRSFLFVLSVNIYAIQLYLVGLYGTSRFFTHLEPSLYQGSVANIFDGCTWQSVGKIWLIPDSFHT